MCIAGGRAESEYRVFYVEIKTPLLIKSLANESMLKRVTTLYFHKLEKYEKSR